MTERSPIVVGLGGYLRHGKDALADALLRQGEEPGERPWTVFGMSDALNDVLKVLDPVIPVATIDGVNSNITMSRYSAYVEEHGYVEAKKHPEVRRLLQYMGTEVGRRMIDMNLWVNMAQKRAAAALRAGQGTTSPSRASGSRTNWT